MFVRQAQLGCASSATSAGPRAGSATPRLIEYPPVSELCAMSRDELAKLKEKGQRSTGAMKLGFKQKTKLGAASLPKVRRLCAGTQAKRIKKST